MIHFYRSNENFRPKRSIQKAENEPAVWSRSEEGQPKAPKRPKASPQQLRTWLERSRQKQYELKDEVSRQLKQDLSRKEVRSAISTYTEGLAAYDSKGGWRKWNDAFAEKMKAEDEAYKDPKAARERIKAMQRVIFSELGLAGDPGAAVDGKIGPYTRAAMAMYVGQRGKIPIPQPGRNTSLLKVSIQERLPELDEEPKDTEEEKRIAAEKARAEENRKMQAVLKRERDKLKHEDEREDFDNNAYVVKEGDGYVVKVWKPIRLGALNVRQDNPGLNKLHPGGKLTLDIAGEKVRIECVRSNRGVYKYKVEGVEGEWGVADMSKKALEVAFKRHDKKKPDGVPAEELNAPERQRQGVAMIPGAKPLGGGVYLVETAGRKTYFRYNNGLWQWASQTQKDKGDWEFTGSDHYKDPKMKAVNDISDRLAGTFITGPVAPKETPEVTPQALAFSAAALTVPFIGLNPLLMLQGYQLKPPSQNPAVMPVSAAVPNLKLQTPNLFSGLPRTAYGGIDWSATQRQLNKGGTS